MMTISEDFLFRLEKFGGILINKVTFDRIELDESEAYFLYLVQNHGFEIATSFFKKEIKAGKLERVLLLNIYSDNTDSEKIRKALENVFGQKDTAVIMGKVATKKANLVIRAKEITRKLNHNEY